MPPWSTMSVSLLMVSMARSATSLDPGKRLPSIDLARQIGSKSRANCGEKPGVEHMAKSLGL
jgi:hypothetical protein